MYSFSNLKFVLIMYSFHKLTVGATCESGEFLLSYRPFLFRRLNVTYSPVALSSVVFVFDPFRSRAIHFTVSRKVGNWRRDFIPSLPRNMIQLGSKIIQNCIMFLTKVYHISRQR
jgi:hypothetical protein